MNPEDDDISGKLVHTAVTGTFAQGTTFEVTVFANRGRLDTAKTAAFGNTRASELQVTLFGWGDGDAPTINQDTDNWSRKPLVKLQRSFTNWAQNGEWASQTFEFAPNKELRYISLAIAGKNHKNASYVAFDIE